MDQNKIGNLIRELRKSSNLTQAQFAEKYGVTYQAVNKRENRKNIPDISLLKQICNDFDINIDDLLEGKNKKNKKSKAVVFYLTISFIVLLLLLLIIILITKDNESFTFKTLSSSCSNFEISGSAAYNKNKSYLYISNITYCGEADNTDYQTIECLLYESRDNLKIELNKYTYNNNDTIKLEDFLQTVQFNVDDFYETCNEIEKHDLFLEINCIDKNDKITTYKIPLTLNDNCSST